VSTVAVVQFVHPGFEYRSRDLVGPRSQAAGVMAWKTGRSRHNRKFIVSLGCAYDRETDVDHRWVPLVFWGEWEGPSVFWRRESSGRPSPSIVHAPFRPETWPSGSFQNTDPLVFGSNIIYSNCMQGTYKALRGLTPGSIILFGRHGRQDRAASFGLDTCLVVDRQETMRPVSAGTIGGNLLHDAVLAPLSTEIPGDSELSVYVGKGRLASESPFSFFPAQLATPTIPLFARPVLEPKGALEHVLSPANMQGIKVSYVELARRDSIWAEVVDQVSGQDCFLGYHAAAPPVMSDQAAEAAARGTNPTWLHTATG
jgi:hypothetical protein